MTSMHNRLRALLALAGWTLAAAMALLAAVLSASTRAAWATVEYERNLADRLILHGELCQERGQ